MKIGTSKRPDETSETAPSWTCVTCTVRVTFAPDQAPADAPDGWELADTGWICLGCRRRKVVEGLVDGPTATLAAQRRRALTEFELLRRPEDSDHVIARRAHCQARYVTPVRRQLVEEGRLAAPPPPKPG